VAAAVWFPRARSVELRTEALPDPESDEVRVRAALSAISHGTEMLVYRGEVDADLALDLPTLAGGYGFPLKYGYANVGRTVAVGRDVRGLREGDLVFALHPHQDEYVVSESLVRRLPDRTAPEQGVFLANLETAINVVLDAKPRLGEVVARLSSRSSRRRSGVRSPNAAARRPRSCPGRPLFSARSVRGAARTSPSMRAAVPPRSRRRSTASRRRAPSSSAPGMARSQCPSTSAVASTAGASAW
jgi:hypothetical protein